MLEGAEQGRSGRMPWAQTSTNLSGYLGGMHGYEDDDHILTIVEVSGSGWVTIASHEYFLLKCVYAGTGGGGGD